MRYGDPLADGLLYTVAYNQNEGLGGISLYQREEYALPNGTAEIRATPYGNGLWETNGSYSYYSFPEGSMPTGNGDVSTFVIVNLDSLATFPTFWKITGATQDALHCGATSGTGSDGQVNFVLSGVATTNSGIVLTAGHWYGILMSYRRLKGVEFWVKDLETGEIRYADIARTNTPATVTGTPCLIGANSTSGTNSSMNGYLPVVHIWNRALGEVDFERLCNDPYSMFSSIVGRRYFVPAGPSYLQVQADMYGSSESGATSQIVLTVEADTYGVSTSGAIVVTGLTISADVHGSSVASGQSVTTKQIAIEITGSSVADVMTNFIRRISADIGAGGQLASNLTYALRISSSMYGLSVSDIALDIIQRLPGKVGPIIDTTGSMAKITLEGKLQQVEMRGHHHVYSTEGRYHIITAFQER